jgi:ribonucleotide reductase beta subunit family protein with ferritin-like domain
MDPVLSKNPNRYVLFPIRHPEVYRMYQKAKACFWTPEEVQLDQDLVDWAKLSPDARHYISQVLAFFAGSDGIVIENLVQNVATAVQMPEARAFYAFQEAMETIHSEMYSLLIDTYVDDPIQKQRLFQGIHEIESIRAKAQWATKWIQHSRKFGSLLVAFAAVEGIMFSSSFAAIFWLKSKGVMPGLCFSNELIARDEGLHTDFAVMMFHKLNDCNRPKAPTVRKIIREACELEKKFARSSIPPSLTELHGPSGAPNMPMEQYIEFVTNRLLASLGQKPMYTNAHNPFPWMKMISMNGKTNFFERRVGEYARAGVMVSAKERVFGLDAAF